MAVTTPYNSDATVATEVVAPPFFKTFTVSSSSENTTEFENVTQFLMVQNMGIYEVRVGVFSAASKGVQGSAYFPLRAGQVFSAPMQTKKVIVREDAGSGSVDCAIFATLSTMKADDFPALTEANGFDGVE